jgi:ketosteroid isomerase-like protein/heme-degrading monooxygenase HmoA
MIVRMWHGRVPIEKARAYREFLNKRAIPDYQSVPGNISVHILERKEGDITHFITMTFWENMDVIRGFAGEDVGRAKYYPEDKDFLLEFEPMVVHYEVVGQDSDREGLAILETDKKWAEAVAEGKDIDRMISFWADDAAVFPPGMPAVIGKAAIKEFVHHSLAIPGFSIRWETTAVNVSPDGTFAYATGTNQTTMNDSQGRQIIIHGKAVTVWRKESSGDWKCVVDIWNDDPQK